MIRIRCLSSVALSVALAACSSVTPEPEPGTEGEVGGPDAGTGGTITSCTAEGADLVYVVDRDYRLLSFDPRKLGTSEPFDLVGQLDCPAGASWPGFGEAVATPFSMSVDRQGRAWVLYSSGEVFEVSTKDANCRPSQFQKGQKGFELFGMGFVSDGPDAEAESLYIAGGIASQLQIGAGALAKVSDGTMEVTELGDITAGEANPEMTGTGDGELYGYFPGLFSSFVARMDKTTGAVLEQWSITNTSGVNSWAFAHWGGKFYIFASTGGLLTPPENKVVVFDPAAGSDVVAIGNSQYQIVGAGVSTCAPVVVE